MFYLIIRALAKALCRIFFRLEVYGRKNLPQEGGFILAANHTSYLDPPVAAVACPRVLSFLAKEELFRNVFFGRFIGALNAFPLNNKSNLGDIRALRWAVKALRAGRAIIIFPEGERTADGQLSDPLRGVGFLAACANVPVVAAFIEGTNKAMPIDSNFIRPEKIKVYFARPIFPQEIDTSLNKDLYQSIAKKVMDEISKLKEKVAFSQKLS